MPRPLCSASHLGALMLVRLNHKVHVLFRRQDLDMVKLDAKVVVVLDVLFATSTMIAALADGASEVIPTLNEEHARERRR
jgi:2-phosphosulfolactate phosphatase